MGKKCRRKPAPGDAFYTAMLTVALLTSRPSEDGEGIGCSKYPLWDRNRPTFSGAGLNLASSRESPGMV
jgi:hypothetical protein